MLLRCCSMYIQNPVAKLVIFSATCIRHIALMLRAWRPSVRLSVTLVDCYHIVQPKVEFGTRQDGSKSWLAVFRSRPWFSGSILSQYCNFCCYCSENKILIDWLIDWFYYLIIPNSTEEDQWRVGNCGVSDIPAANSAFDGSHVALSQHLLSFLLKI